MALKEVPSFMEDDAKSHFRQSLVENRDLWIEAARFESQHIRGWEARLHVILATSELKKSNSPDEWRTTVEENPIFELEEGGRTRGDTPDRTARAFYMLAAIKRLLELVKAPAYLQAELNHFVKSSLPREVENKANLQALLIDRPDLKNVAEIARSVGITRRLVKRWIDEGAVQRMP